MREAEEVAERSLDARMRLAIPVRTDHEGSHRVGNVVRGQPDVSDHTRSVDVRELERGACRYLASGCSLATFSERTACKASAPSRTSRILERDRAAAHAAPQLEDIIHAIHQ